MSFLIATVAQLLILAIIVRAVLSWFPTSRSLAPVQAFLNDATDPVLQPIRRRLPYTGAFDVSPLIAIVLISIVEYLLLGILGGH